MKKLILLVLIISLVFIVGCDLEMEGVGDVFEKPVLQNNSITNLTSKVEVKKEETKIEIKTEETKSALKCTHSSNCTEKELCIEGSCQLLASVYKTEGCTKKCNFQKIKITTGDGEKYELSRGQGSYTAASALEWTISSGPDYCFGEKIIIPIKVLKRNYGKVFADEVVLLNVGVTSKTITHPLMPEIAFTLRVGSVEESCE